MTVVLVVAAAGAAVLLLSIVAMARARSSDEIDRFRHAAALTSRWASEHHDTPQTLDLRDAPTPADAAPAPDPRDPTTAADPGRRVGARSA